MTTGALGELPDPAGLRTVEVDVSTGGAGELKIWAHALTPEGISTALPMSLTVQDGDATRELDLDEPDGQVVVGLSSDRCTVRFARHG